MFRSAHNRSAAEDFREARKVPKSCGAPRIRPFGSPVEYLAIRPFFGCGVSRVIPSLRSRAEFNTDAYPLSVITSRPGADASNSARVGYLRSARRVE